MSIDLREAPVNSALLALLVIATGCAAWSAADVGTGPSEPLFATVTPQRQATAPRASGHGCIATGDRIVLRAPRLEAAGLPTADHARAERALVDDWRRDMIFIGVPVDLLDKTLRMPNRTYELSNHEMDRLSCSVG